MPSVMSAMMSSQKPMGGGMFGYHTVEDQKSYDPWED